MKVVFTSMVGDHDLVLWVPPEMRLSLVMELASDHLHYRAMLQEENLHRIIDIQVITPEGRDIRSDGTFRAWLVGSKQPGSLFSRWMLKVELSRLETYFAQARNDVEQRLAEEEHLSSNASEDDNHRMMEDLRSILMEHEDLLH